MFKVGDKIVCIDDEYGHANFPFTFEKIYEVVIIDNYNKLGLVSDKGKYYEPNWRRFVSLKEYRKIKLEELKASIDEE